MENRELVKQIEAYLAEAPIPEHERELFKIMYNTLKKLGQVCQRVSEIEATLGELNGKPDKR